MDEQSTTDVKESAAVAAERTKEVAGTASEQARTVADSAREHAGEVREEVAKQSREIVHQAKAKLREQGRAQTHELASTVRGWAGQTQALADGRPHEAGPVADYARRAADRATTLAGKLEERGMDGILDDLQRFARRRPGVFLLGAAVAGFGVGRLVRGASAGNGSGENAAPASPPDGQTTFADYERASSAATAPVGATRHADL
jgi:hypothetical protein